MGITHGWLLSRHHDVSWLVRGDRADFYGEPFELRVHDLRPGRRDTTATVSLKLVTSIAPDLYDAVLVMVPGRSLADVLPVLDGAGTDVPVVLMLNHWNLAGALGGSSEPRANRLLGFPSQVGGGRHGHRLSVTVFPRGTVLEAGTASKKAALDKAEALLASGDSPFAASAVCPTGSPCTACSRPSPPRRSSRRGAIARSPRIGRP